MTEILFGDGKRYSRDWLDSHPDQAQQVLRRYKQTYPLCLCKGEGIPLHIRELSSTGTLYLARMPGSGPRHAVGCPSYEPIHGPAEAEALEAGSIKMLADGRVVFALDASLDVREQAGAQLPRAPAAELPQAVSAAKPRLGLFALLQYLWGQAELHHWHPKMAERRRYRQVYQRLCLAADSILVKGFALRYRLFLPEPFNPKKAAAIDADRIDRISRMARGANGRRRRFLALGRLRGVTTHGGLTRITLGHLSDNLVIHVDAKLWKRLCRRWDIEDLGGEENDLLVWGLFLIDRYQQGVMKASAAALLQTTEQYIPVYRPAEVALAYALIENQRRFIKMLSLDGRPSEGQPAFLLTDVGETPMPLYITDDPTPPDTRAADEWYWHVSKEPSWPPLPMSVGPNAGSRSGSRA